jgi:hypothetical protein
MDRGESQMGFFNGGLEEGAHCLRESNWVKTGFVLSLLFFEMLL